MHRKAASKAALRWEKRKGKKDERDAEMKGEGRGVGLVDGACSHTAPHPLLLHRWHRIDSALATVRTSSEKRACERLARLLIPTAATASDAYRPQQAVRPRFAVGLLLF